MSLIPYMINEIIKEAPKTAKIEIVSDKMEYFEKWTNNKRDFPDLLVQNSGVTVFLAFKDINPFCKNSSRLKCNYVNFRQAVLFENLRKQGNKCMFVYPGNFHDVLFNLFKIRK